MVIQKSVSFIDPLGILTPDTPDTRLPKSRAGGQGPYLRSIDFLGKSSNVQKEEKSKV